MPEKTPEQTSPSSSTGSSPAASRGPIAWVAGLVLVALVVAGGVWAVVAGGSSSDDSPSGGSPAAAPPPGLADLSLASATAERAPFCDALSSDAVAAALRPSGEGSSTGSSPSAGSGSTALPAPTTWRDGQVADLGAPGAKDTKDTKGTQDTERSAVSEDGCSWTEDGTTAAAWVFSPPVSLAQARSLAKESPRAGCTPVKDAPAFGRPSAAWTCPVTADSSAKGAKGAPRQVERRWTGLFGDAWLTCSLTGPDTAETAQRADRWCASVAMATTGVGPSS